MSKELHIKDPLNSRDLFEAFKQQLQKDLSESGCESDFINGIAADATVIKEALTKALVAYEKKAGSNLQHLIYRIDINEKQLSEHLREHKEEAYLSVVAELMIKRILQKVVLKKYFSNNE